MTAPVTRVCAVVLTYNRRELLRECLDAIAAQTRPPDHVLVVDNASTDGTADLLERAYPEVEVLRLPINEGSAGGFHACLEAACARGYDATWLMDDDVLPHPDALAALLDKGRELSNYGFLCSRVVGTNGVSMNVPHVDLRSSVNAYPVWDEHLDLGVVRLQNATFVSVLIPTRTVLDFGLPLRDMYIFGEDTEYTLRITRTRPGYLVGASVAVHKRVLQGPLDIARERNPARLAYFAHRIRNEVYNARTHKGWPRVAVVFGKYALQLPTLARGPLGLRRLGLVARGLLGGLTFRPRPEPYRAVRATPAGGWAPDVVPDTRRGRLGKARRDLN
ncbi:glycosyltransferase family 2 protein [Deinococcus yunweiensis]|uniref:glycosyltransferase family 2 protein n=1 Tax=Deinococcus yunweiensis TaxID=367282 RepID=UPI00398EE1B8